MSAERRKNARLGLAIPVRVQGYRGDGSTWEEFTTTDDVSLGGSCFALSHEVELGQILFLSLALPRRLRQFDLQDATYRIYTLARSVRRRPDQPRVGVMFFGKYPPRGFHDRPGARYLLPSDAPSGTPAPTASEPPPAEPPPHEPTPEAPGEAADATGETSRGPGAESHPEPAAQPGLLDDVAAARQATPGPPETPEPLSGSSEDPDEPESSSRPLESLAESLNWAPRTDDPPAPRAANWGTQAASEPRPGIPPPPAADAPTVEFHPSREVPQDRRSFPRMELFVNFTIQQVDEWGAVLQEELTVADNVGRGGARVMTTLVFGEGSVILLQEAGGGFATRAEVRGITRIQPGTDRLHLRFVDREAPERLLRQ
jgi:hypothetical protein